MRNPRTATKSSSRSPQLEKAHAQQQRPNTAKKKKRILIHYRPVVVLTQGKSQQQAKIRLGANLGSWGWLARCTYQKGIYYKGNINKYLTEKFRKYWEKNTQLSSHIIQPFLAFWHFSFNFFSLILYLSTHTQSQPYRKYIYCVFYIKYFSIL